MIVAQAFTDATPTDRGEQTATKPRRNRSCWRDLLWAVLSAMAVTIFFSSHYFSSLLGAKSVLASTPWRGTA